MKRLRSLYDVDVRKETSFKGESIYIPKEMILADNPEIRDHLKNW